MTSTADRIDAPEARPPSRGAPHLDEAALEALAADLDVIRRREMADRGEADAAYIRRVAAVATALQVGGRVAIALGRRRPVWWAGVLGVAAGRVIEAMEIGHNVLHGQYDWMRDPRFDSSTYEWNMTAPADQWRHAHNVVHHVNANVAGVDRDLGYGVVRITDDQPWKPSHLGNPAAALFLALLFDQAIGFYDLEAERQALGLVDPDEARAKFEASLAKLKRQMLRDFVLVPLLAGKAAPRALAGSVGRPGDRQRVGLRHHLLRPLPVRHGDLPARRPRGRDPRPLVRAPDPRGRQHPGLVPVPRADREPEPPGRAPPVSRPARRAGTATSPPRSRRCAARYGLPYNSKRFSRQFGSVLWRIVRMSLPDAVRPSRRGARS